MGAEMSSTETGLVVKLTLDTNQYLGDSGIYPVQAVFAYDSTDDTVVKYIKRYNTLLRTKSFHPILDNAINEIKKMVLNETL